MIFLPQHDYPVGGIPDEVWRMRHKFWLPSQMYSKRKEPFVCRVLTQIVDALRPLPLAQIIGAANDHERERRRRPDDYHVWRDELAQTDTGIKPFGREVDQLLACGDLHFNLGIGLTERWYQGFQQDRHHRARH